MAALSGSQRLPDNVDYSVSHRPAPARPTRDLQAPSSPIPPDSRGELANPKAGGGGGGRRRGSFSALLRRGSSGNTKNNIASSNNHNPSDAPPVPAVDPSRFSAGSDARISQGSNSIPDSSTHHLQQLKQQPEPHHPYQHPHPQEPQSQHGHTANNHSRSTTSYLHNGNRLRKNSVNREPNMLRKTSRKQRELQLEQERLEREAYANRLAPHVSLNPLPNISSFAAEDGDSRAGSYYNASTSNDATAATPYNAAQDYGEFSNNPYQAPQHSPRPTANFSRPAAMPPPSSHGNDHQASSSPAYAVRSTPNNHSSPATGIANGEYVAARNSNPRTESMTNRGRYSYASSTTQVNNINSPRRVRRRKDPTPFNVLVIGAKNSGKTSFISFLRHSFALPANKHQSADQSESRSSKYSTFNSHYLETEIDGERVGLTIWDSAGLEKNIVDLQMREMTAFVEAKFEDTFVEEQKVMRSPGAKDTHIHCVFLILDPMRLDMTVTASMAASKMGGVGAGSLDNDLDLLVMRSLWGKTTVIPVMSKADTLTAGHMAYLKRAVSQSLKYNKLDPLEALELEDDSEDDADSDADSVVINNLAPADDVESQDRVSDLTRPSATNNKSSHKRHSSLSSLSAINAASVDGEELPYLPMSILSPDPYDLPPYVKPSAQIRLGRRFPWGFADPYDAAHCDFGRLRESVFSAWRADLRELSRTKWYENWRTSRLKKFPGATAAGNRGGQRVKGGVTPVSSVPREGRGGSRQVAPIGAATSSPPVAASESVLSTPPTRPPVNAPPPPPTPAVDSVAANGYTVPSSNLHGDVATGVSAPASVPRSVSGSQQQLQQPPAPLRMPSQDMLNAKTGVLPGAFPREV